MAHIMLKDIMIQERNDFEGSYFQMQKNQNYLLSLQLRLSWSDISFHSTNNISNLLLSGKNRPRKHLKDAQ